VHGGGEDAIGVAGDGDGDFSGEDFFVDEFESCIGMNGDDDEALVLEVSMKAGEFGDCHD